NHFHGIVEIIDPDKTVGIDPCVNPDKEGSQNQGGHPGPPQPGLNQPGTNPKTVGADPRISPKDNDQLKPDFEPKPASIPSIVQWFKTMTTNQYIKGVKNGQYPPFDRKLWQRNYHDHIIRDEESLKRIRYYIMHN